MRKPIRLNGSSVDCTRFRDFDVALRRFSRKIKEDGRLIDLKESQHHVTKGQAARLQREKAKRRNARKLKAERALQNRLY